MLGVVYTIWTIIFEAAGWKNENGETYVYAAYDWSESLMPLFFFFLSAAILTIYSVIATFIKNLILMKSDIGPKMIAIRKSETENTSKTTNTVVEI